MRGEAARFGKRWSPRHGTDLEIVCEPLPGFRFADGRGQERLEPDPQRGAFVCKRQGSVFSLDWHFIRQGERIGVHRFGTRCA